VAHLHGWRASPRAPPGSRASWRRTYLGVGAAQLARCFWPAISRATSTNALSAGDTWVRLGKYRKDVIAEAITRAKFDRARELTVREAIRLRVARNPMMASRQVVGHGPEAAWWPPPSYGQGRK
jgi:hypothetical protein